MSSGRIIALDLGIKRIGLAVSDSNRVLAMPWAVINRMPDYVETYKSIKRSLDSIEVSLIVVGLPVSLDGKIRQAASNIHKEAENLVQLFNIEWLFWDERNSSKQVVSLITETTRRSTELLSIPQKEKYSKETGGKTITTGDVLSYASHDNKNDMRISRKHLPLRTKKKIQTIDDKAAAIILQAYLDAIK
jgi:putative Holliday junction resolvase